MNQINIIAVTDLEHSSPRVTNLLFYLDNKKFNKYVVGANHIGFISKNDFPNNFFQNITYRSFIRSINIFRFLKRSSNNYESNNKVKIKSRSFIGIKKVLLKFVLTILFPDQYFFTVRKYISITSKLIKEMDGPIIILTSYPYPTPHIAGFLLKRKFNDKIIWIADYRDLWTLNHNYSFNIVRKFFDKILEKYITVNADIITTVSQSLSKAQSKFLNKNVSIIYNGYSFENEAEINIKSYKDRYFKYDKKYILYVGSIYFDNMDINLLTSNLNKYDENFEIHFIGSHSDMLQKIIEDNKLSNCIKQNGRFSRKESMSIQKLYDFLLMFDSTTDSGVIPLKFYEYIQASNPILCVGGTKNSEVKQIIRKIKRGYILEKSTDLDAFFNKKIHLNFSLDIEESVNYSYSYEASSKNLEKIIIDKIKNNTK
tara:strand:+ start:6941 stop:8221 length:1281 start_codon:yes stop_codon:yes gene_type:complete